MAVSFDMLCKVAFLTLLIVVIAVGYIAYLRLFLNEEWVKLCHSVERVLRYTEISIWLFMGWFARPHMAWRRRETGALDGYFPLEHSQIIMRRQLTQAALIGVAMFLSLCLSSAFPTEYGPHALPIHTPPPFVHKAPELILGDICAPLLHPLTEKLDNVSLTGQGNLLVAQATCNAVGNKAKRAANTLRRKVANREQLLFKTNNDHAACIGEVVQANLSMKALLNHLSDTKTSLKTAVTLRSLEVKELRKKLSVHEDSLSTCTHNASKLETFVNSCKAQVSASSGDISARCAAGLQTLDSAISRIYSLLWQRALVDSEFLIKRLLAKGYEQQFAQHMRVLFLVLAFGLPLCAMLVYISCYGLWPYLKLNFYWFLCWPMVKLLALKPLLISPVRWLLQSAKLIEEGRKITSFSDIPPGECAPIHGKYWMCLHERAPLVPMKLGPDAKFITDVPVLPPHQPQPGPVPSGHLGSAGESIVNSDQGVVCDFPVKTIQLMLPNGSPFCSGTNLDIVSHCLPSVVTRHNTEGIPEFLVRGPHPKHRITLPASRIKWVPHKRTTWLQCKMECSMYDLGFIEWTADERSYLGLTGFTMKELCFDPEGRTAKVSYFSPTKNAFIAYSGRIPPCGVWASLTGVGYMPVNTEPGASSAKVTVVDSIEKIIGIVLGQGSNVLYKYRETGNMYATIRLVLSAMEELGIRTPRTSLQLDRWVQGMLGYKAEKPMYPAGPVKHELVDAFLSGNSSPAGEAKRKRKQPRVPREDYPNGDDKENVPMWYEYEQNTEAYRDTYDEECKREETERWGGVTDEHWKNDHSADSSKELDDKENEEENDRIDREYAQARNDGEDDATAETGRRQRKRVTFSSDHNSAGEAAKRPPRERAAALMSTPTTLAVLVEKFSLDADALPTSGYDKNKCLASSHKYVGPPPVSASNIQPSTAAATAAAVDAEFAKEAAEELRKLREARLRLDSVTNSHKIAIGELQQTPAEPPDAVVSSPETTPATRALQACNAPTLTQPAAAGECVLGGKPIGNQPATVEKALQTAANPTGAAGESATMAAVTVTAASLLALKALKNKRKRDNRKAGKLHKRNGCIFDQPMYPGRNKENVAKLPKVMPIPADEHPTKGAVAGAQHINGRWELPDRKVGQVCKVVQRYDLFGYDQVYYLPVTKAKKIDTPTIEDIKETYRNLFVMLTDDKVKKVVSPAVECGRNRQSVDEITEIIDALCVEFGIVWLWFIGPPTPGLNEKGCPPAPSSKPATAANPHGGVIGPGGYSFRASGDLTRVLDPVDHIQDMRSLLEQEQDRKKYQPSLAAEFKEITDELARANYSVLEYERTVEENKAHIRSMAGKPPPPPGDSTKFSFVPNPLATLGDAPGKLKQLSARAKARRDDNQALRQMRFTKEVEEVEAPFVSIQPHLARITHDKLLEAARVEQTHRIALRKMLKDVKENRAKALLIADKTGWTKPAGEAVTVDGSARTLDDALVEWKVKFSLGEVDNAVKEIWQYAAQFPDVYTRLNSIFESPILDKFKEYRAKVCPTFFKDGEKPDAEIMPDRYGNPYFREVGYYKDAKPLSKQKGESDAVENAFQAGLRGLAAEHCDKGKYILPPQGVEAQKASMRAQAALACAKDAPLDYQEECELASAGEFTSGLYNDSLTAYTESLPHKANSAYRPPPPGGWDALPESERPHNQVTGMSEEYHSTPLEPTYSKHLEEDGNFVGKVESLLERGNAGFKEALSGLHDKSSGASNRYRPGWTKKQWATEEPIEVIDFALTRLILTAVATYDDGIVGLRAMDLAKYGISDPKELHVKNEVLSPGKIKEGRYRLIWGCSLIDIVVQTLLHKADNSAHIESYQLGHMIHAALGLGHHDEGIQTLIDAARQQGLDRNVITSDASAYDFSILGRLVWADGRRRSRAINGAKPYLAALILMFSHVLCCHLVTAGDTVYECMKYGVTCSGMISTGSQNTFIRLVLAFFAGAVCAIAIGDDMIADPGFSPARLLKLGIRSRDVVHSPGPVIDFTSHKINCSTGTAEYGNIEKMLWHQYEVSSDDYCKYVADENGDEAPTWPGEVERLNSIMYIIRNTPSVRDSFLQLCREHGKLP